MTAFEDDLVDALAPSRELEPPPIAMDLERELATLQAVAPRAPRQQLAMIGIVSVLYGACLLALLSVRKDLRELPPSWVVGSACLRFLGFLGLCAIALVPRPGTMTHRLHAAGAGVAIIALVLVVFGLAVHPSGPSSLHYGWALFPRGHHCLEIGLLVAVAPVVVALVFLRGALPVGSGWIFAAIGAGGGCLGGLVLHLYCRVADGLHIGLIHGGVCAVAALIAAAIGGRRAL